GFFVDPVQRNDAGGSGSRDRADAALKNDAPGRPRSSAGRREDAESRSPRGAAARGVPGAVVTLSDGRRGPSKVAGFKVDFGRSKPAGWAIVDRWVDRPAGSACCR